MTDRELMQQALEALTYVTRHFTRTPSTLKDSDARAEAHKAIAALRERLAQPEQEPVAWTGVDFAVDCTPPRREWVGLTRDEVLDIEETAKHPLDFARSIEAKLREKNNG